MLEEEEQMANTNMLSKAADSRENQHARRLKKLGRVLQTVAAVLVTMVMAFPIYWMFITAVKGDNEMMQLMPTLWPESFHWENFLTVFERIPLWRYLFNTMVVTFSTMLIEVPTAILAAYGFARGRFKGRDILFVLVLGALMIPHQVTFVPMYLIIAKLGWVDSFPGLILPRIGAAHMTFMLRQNFRSINQDYLDAGRLDGLGIVGNITHIMVPMARAAIATAAMNSFISGWNSYFWPKILTKSDRTRVLTIGMMQLRTSWGESHMYEHFNVILAGVFLTVVPVLILFLFNQKNMVKGYAKMNFKKS